MLWMFGRICDKDKETNEMNSTEIVISKKVVYAVTIGLLILIALLLFVPGFGQSNNASSTDLAAGSQEKFAFLSGQGSQRSVGST